MSTDKSANPKEEQGLTIFGTLWRIAVIFFLGFSVFLIISTMMLQFLTKSGSEVIVPDVTGKQFMSVYNSLSRRELLPDISYRDVYDMDDGIILEQSPEAGKSVPEGTKVKLKVSRSAILIDVPILAGTSFAMAKNKLKNLHFNEKPVSLPLGMVTYLPSDKTAENIVIAQIPPAAQKVKPDRRVNLLVSAGKLGADQNMPDVAGQSIDLCFDLLLAKGYFIDEDIVNTNDPNQNGIVFAQNPPKETALNRGDTAKLKVYYYPAKERPYYSYEKIEYKIPADEKEGIYEAYIEDHNSKRTRFFKKMKPGEDIRFVFYRTGNAKVTILRDKKSIRVFGINAD